MTCVIFDRVRAVIVPVAVMDLSAFEQLASERMSVTSHDHKMPSFDPSNEMPHASSTSRATSSDDDERQKVRMLK